MIAFLLLNYEHMFLNLFFFQNESTLEKMHHHVTGVLCHGLNKAYTFTWTDQFSSDCNITLNCLMSVLGDVAAVSIKSQV